MLVVRCTHMRIAPSKRRPRFDGGAATVIVDSIRHAARPLSPRHFSRCLLPPTTPPKSPWPPSYALQTFTGLQPPPPFPSLLLPSAPDPPSVATVSIGPVVPRQNAALTLRHPYRSSYLRFLILVCFSFYFVG